MAIDKNADFTPSIPDSDVVPTKLPYNQRGGFKFWAQKVIPLVYNDSLSYYEVLCKVVNYLNNVIQNVDNLNESVNSTNQSFETLKGYVNTTKDTLINTYNELQDYVNTYFDNLDVQEEINAKLDAMADSGELTNLLAPFIPDLVTQWLNNHVTPTSPVVDNTLTISGAAADAKVTGDNFTDLKEDLSEITEVYGKNIFDESVLIRASGWVSSNDDYYGVLSNLITAFSNELPIYGDFETNTQYTVSLLTYNANATGSETGNSWRINVEYTDGTSSALIYINRKYTEFTKRTGTTTAGKTVKKLSIAPVAAISDIWHIKEFQIEKGDHNTDYESFSITAVDLKARTDVRDIYNALLSQMTVSWSKGAINARGSVETSINAVYSKVLSDVEKIEIDSTIAFGRFVLYANGVYLGKINTNEGIDQLSGNWKSFTGTIDIPALLNKYNADSFRLSLYPNDSTTITDLNAQTWGDSACDVYKFNLGGDNESIPTYYTDYPTALENARNDMGVAGYDGFSFIFSSDQHWESSAQVSPILISDALHQLNLPYLVLGGDLINGGAGVTREEAMKRLADAFKHYNLADYTFAVIGNHDSNHVGTSGTPSAWLSNKDLYSVIMRQLDTKVTYSDFNLLTRLPYFCDIENLKTRLIFVDTYIEGVSLYQSQIDWITNTLNSTPTDYKIIIYAHIWCQQGSDDFGLDFATQGTQIINVADAFNASSTGAKIVAMFGGHVHKDANYITQSGINLILIDCDSMKTLSNYGNIAGTQTETCFDIVTVDYANKTINCRRVGRGIDRSFSWT